MREVPVWAMDDKAVITRRRKSARAINVAVYVFKQGEHVRAWLRCR